MSTDRAEAAVETAIAKHVAESFQGSGLDDRSQAVVSRVRDRITDRFHPAALPNEQDNQPPALVALYRRIATAFSSTERASDPSDRSRRLADLKRSLETMRRAQPTPTRSPRLDHARTRLLMERQHLVVKNEFTEVLGRIEVWLLSIASLALVLLNVVSLVWALPILAFSICRSWYLDSHCKSRLKKISEIDALIDRIEIAS